MKVEFVILLLAPCNEILPPSYKLALFPVKIEHIILPLAPSQRIAPPHLAVLLMKKESVKVPLLPLHKRAPPPELAVLLMKIQLSKVPFSPFQTRDPPLEKLKFYENKLFIFDNEFFIRF